MGGGVDREEVMAVRRWSKLARTKLKRHDRGNHKVNGQQVVAKGRRGAKTVTRPWGHK